MRLRPVSTLFPYTTLFRSCIDEPGGPGRLTVSGMASSGSPKVHPLIDRLAAYSWRLLVIAAVLAGLLWLLGYLWVVLLDRKSTRLNSSHVRISYAVFCLKK